MKKQRMNQTTKNEKGQSLMELAISLVIFLIILSGIVDLGRAILVRFIIQDAAEEGIVYGTGFPTDCNQIDTRIRDNIGDVVDQSSMIVNILIQNQSEGIYESCYSIDYVHVYAGEIMKIEITYDFPISMPFLGTILGSQKIPLTITTNGVILRPQPPGT